MPRLTLPKKMRTIEHFLRGHKHLKQANLARLGLGSVVFGTRCVPKTPKCWTLAFEKPYQKRLLREIFWNSSLSQTWLRREWKSHGVWARDAWPLRSGGQSETIPMWRGNLWFPQERLSYNQTKKLTQKICRVSLCRRKCEPLSIFWEGISSHSAEENANHWAFSERA